MGWGAGVKGHERTDEQRAHHAAQERARRARNPEAVRAAMRRYAERKRLGLVGQPAHQERKPSFVMQPTVRRDQFVSISRLHEAEAVRKVVARAAAEGTLTTASPWYGMDPAEIMLAPLGEDGRVKWRMPTHRSTLQEPRLY